MREVTWRCDADGDFETVTMEFEDISDLQTRILSETDQFVDNLIITTCSQKVEKEYARQLMRWPLRLVVLVLRTTFSSSTTSSRCCCSKKKSVGIFHRKLPSKQDDSLAQDWPIGVFLLICTSEDEIKSSSNKNGELP